MAMTSFVIRRAFSSSSSSSSSSSPYVIPLFASRFLPFSTSTSSLEASNNLEQTAFGTSGKPSLLDGLPFDSMEVDRKDRTMTLRRKTKDEIIEILVKEDYRDRLRSYNDDRDYRKCSWMFVKILYGLNFQKNMEFEIQALPDNPSQFFIRNMKMSLVNKGDREGHLDELEGFLERRGFNHGNLDFMIKYADERRANLKHEPNL